METNLSSAKSIKLISGISNAIYSWWATNLFLAEDELEVIVNIKDTNDNQPEFLTFESPVVVSVSSQLQTGDLIAKMEVSPTNQPASFGAAF